MTPSISIKTTLAVAAAVVACLIASPAAAVVISEIHYNPLGTESTLEFVEIANESSTPEDISGFHFTDGILFEFPARTILRGYSRIVVCADVTAIRDRYGITNALGNFVGRLDNAGERLTLANHEGIEVASLRYRDEGKWSTAADGTGHSLVLRHLSLDPTEPESWTFSPEPGGSPGEPNFPDTADQGFETVVLIDEGDEWRFARGTAPFSAGTPEWFETDFDDSAWDVGPSGFGYGDADDATVLGDMRGGYTSVACRATFELTPGVILEGEVTLGVRFDDGFCAFVNGARAVEENCPATITHDAVATAGHEAAEEELYTVPLDHLRPGTNVIAVVGFNTTVDGTDFSLAPRVIVRRPKQAATGQVVLNELCRSTSGESWVELFNSGSQAVDLGGWTLAADPGGAGSYVLPFGTTLAAGGFYVVSDTASGIDMAAAEVRLFLRDAGGMIAAATAFDGPPPPDAPDADYAEVRFPDGSSELWLTLTPTRGAANTIARTTGIRINEIFYHPPEDRAGEFVEVANFGTEPVDLSGFRFNNGIAFTFDTGTILAPGEFLIVTDDPEAIDRHYTEDIPVAGQFEGRLSNSGENIRLVDRWGNLVDEVRYHEGGAWSLWADGRGSSLELIDPQQRGDAGAAWAASDESDKSRWERLSYSVSDFRAATESELHLLLAERGACLIDEVAIRRGAGSNHIPNAGFESSTSPWIIEGTHQDSRRVTYDSRVGNACLELRASGKGDTAANRIEIETSPRLTNGAYEVSLWARWLQGASVIIARGEFTAGPWGGRPGPSTNMSGNTLGGRFRLMVPTNLGTPGAPNSARVTLIEATGSDNLGPLIRDVAHSPPIPEPNRATQITARVDDSDGVLSVRAFYRQSHAGGTFSSTGLTPRPATSPDDALRGERYTGELPGVPSGRKVVFYIEAVDRRGAIRRYPETAPERTLLYQARTPAAATIESCAIVLDDRRTTELQTRRLHSNHLIDGTFVLNDRPAYYNVGVRYRGSPWGRPERSNYRVRIQRDQPKYSGLDTINLSGRLNGPVESASLFLIGRSGTPDKPASASIYRFVASSFNGSSLGVVRLIQPVDRDYIQRWFPGTEGPTLKAVARLAFTDSGTHRAYDGASFDDMGSNPENYRFYYFQVTDRSRDEWDDLARLMHAMDPRSTSNAEHDATIGDILDVEGFLRVMVPRMFVSDWDTLGMGQGHNAYLTLDTRDGLWETLPFDLNQAMPGNLIDFPVFPTFDRGWARLISRPESRRTYVRIASEFLAGYWSTQTAGPFLSAMEADLPLSMSGVRNFIGARANYIRPRIRSFSEVDFRILTNNGNDFTTDSAVVAFEGEAPVEIASIVCRHNNAESVPLDPEWETPNRWNAAIELRSEENQLDLLGFSTSGNLLTATSIRITTTAIVQATFIRGDANRDDSVDVSDAITILQQLFVGAPVLCEDAADVNNSGTVDISDPIGLLNFLFGSGDPPPSPYPTAGVDTGSDELTCER